MPLCAVCHNGCGHEFVPYGLCHCHVFLRGKGSADDDRGDNLDERCDFVCKTLSIGIYTDNSGRLSSGSLLLFFGSVADLFGRKSMFIVSMFLFSVFCLAAGFSQTGLTVDILCGVLGIFSASAVPPAQGMLGAIYVKPSKRKNRVFGCFSAGNPLGFVFGIIFSGLATQIFSWRASFWLLAIVYLVVCGVAAFTVPKDGQAKVKLTTETVKRLDLPGTAMTILGIGMFCAALR
jgi:MFS family permease